MAEVSCGSWVVVGSDVWVVGHGGVRCLGRWLWLGSVFGLWLKWLKWVVGRRRSPVFRSGEVMARSAWVTVMG